MCVHIYVHVFVCVCVCVDGRVGGGQETECKKEKERKTRWDRWRIQEVDKLRV